MIAFVLLVIGGFVTGGAWSAYQRRPRNAASVVLTVLLAAVAVLLLVSGVLRLFGGSG